MSSGDCSGRRSASGFHGTSFSGRTGRDFLLRMVFMNAAMIMAVW
jgi:hypothetical protein